MQVFHDTMLCFGDHRQTAVLAEDEGGAPVKVGYPYEQLKPYVTPFAEAGPSSGERLDFFDLIVPPTTGSAVSAVP